MRNRIFLIMLIGVVASFFALYSAHLRYEVEKNLRALESEGTISHEDLTWLRELEQQRINEEIVKNIWRSKEEGLKENALLGFPLRKYVPEQEMGEIHRVAKKTFFPLHSEENT